jgi:phosphatidylinositol alpha-mannosyltransferase
LPLVAIRNSNAPVTVGTFHTYFDQSRGFKMLNKKAARHMEKMDGRIVVSEACIEALDRYFDTDYEIIPNGVDTASFHPGAAPPASMDDSKLNILFVGRFDPRNGLRTMIEAFRLVKQDFDACRLVIVGDGPLKPYYRALAGRGLAADIHFAGLVNGGRPGYYAAADVFCTPCNKASFGVVLLEAMASGTPIVASDINGYRSVMQNGRQGLLVPHDSPKAFAESLLLLLEDQELRRRMGEEGRRSVMERYSWDTVAGNIEAFYSRLLYGQAPGFTAAVDSSEHSAPLALVP